MMKDLLAEYGRDAAAKRAELEGLIASHEGAKITTDATKDRLRAEIADLEHIIACGGVV